MADHSNIIRTLVVRAEDSRLMDDMYVKISHFLFRKDILFVCFFCYQRGNETLLFRFNEH